MIGKTLGQYLVVEQIGAGGMGVVYRAYDERLQRHVALKVLPPGLLADEVTRRRFRKEALSLSKLNHPNVATVHDFNTQDGVDFLVMELVPGATLEERLARGALPEKEVLRLGAQLAHGLAAAHANGIVHRDLKPGNLRLTQDGRLKILDFGLAAWLHPAIDDMADTPVLGETQIVIGSPPYMSPEQLRGEEVDLRSDIYGAGGVLYKMVTGQRPFADLQGPRLIDAILHHAPEPPSRYERVSPALEQIILKCLDKDPAHRYQSARELLVDLERLSAPTSPSTGPHPRRFRSRRLAVAAAGLAIPLLGAAGWYGLVDRRGIHTTAEAAPIRSVAVLPLKNVSGDAAYDYFADGMTDALIADLAKIGSLRVISRTSTMQYKDARKPLSEIARALDVEAVVEGSVLRAGDRVRVTAELIEAATDRHLWAENYERDLKDVVTLQGEVARSIAREVRAKLTPQERSRLTASGPVDPEAYEDFLKGIYYANLYTRDGFQKSVTHLERAVARDAGYAPAYAALAQTHLRFAVNQAVVGGPTEGLAKANAYALEALRLDPDLPEAYVAVGNVAYRLNWDWAGAERAFTRARELNPSSARVHEDFAWYLAARGRLDEALAEMEAARRLDPLSPAIGNGVAAILYYSRKPGPALDALRKTLELRPDFAVSHYGLGHVYLQSGMSAAAIEEYEKALAASPDSPATVADLARALAVAGRRQEALKTVERWKRLTKGRFAREDQLAQVYAALGDTERAFGFLQKAYEQRSPGLIWLKVDPRFDTLRADARFDDLLRRIGLQG
jgi:TolB-like protein/Tfp pilus assembly protein PilF